MDPRHPLPPIAQRPAQPQLERQAQARQKAAVAGQYQPGAHQHHANPEALRTLGGFFPGDAQLAGEIFAHRLRSLGQLPFTAIAVPTHGRAGYQHLRALLAAFQPGQQLLGKGDAAGPQQLAPARRPRPVGNRRTGQVDDGVHRVVRRQLLQLGNTAHAPAAQAWYLIRAAAPDTDPMALAEPELAQVLADQAGTTCQQYMHGCVLAECGDGLFLTTRHFFNQTLSDKHRPPCPISGITLYKHCALYRFA